ncbi:MAG: type II toxin-antitoxin system RelB/DinJ family antitoxin [Synergistaceae bacterium]|nr:type II toxin-antitoxin system RelB/DinJ family antitoxin [Synergistaceae bacterium]
MANSLLQFRIDSRLKEEASNLYAQLGLDLPTAIRIFLTRSVQVRGIPFVMQLPAEDADANAAVSAMKRMSAISAENGNSEMTLEEINAEIDDVRKKRA